LNAEKPVGVDCWLDVSVLKPPPCKRDRAGPTPSIADDFASSFVGMVTRSRPSTLTDTALSIASPVGRASEADQIAGDFPSV